jgi:hypothetical protein
MQTLFQSTHNRVRDYQVSDPEPQERITLRVIAWLLFALLTIGGAYLYFNRPVPVDRGYLEEVKFNNLMLARKQNSDRLDREYRRLTGHSFGEASVTVRP